MAMCFGGRFDDAGVVKTPAQFDIYPYTNFDVHFDIINDTL